jgi:tRNA G18 (ribose-2'-O)-methylase SpoU
VLSNIGKKDNFKKLLALAVAYGLDHVLIVGQPGFDLATHAPPASVVPSLADRISLRRFPDLAACKAFLAERGATLYGVEIVAGARLVEDVDFKGRPCAFMMGNEGSGMNKPQLEACDEFVIIPQYGNGTASLNVSNAAAIVLQYFALSRMAS